MKYFVLVMMILPGQEPKFEKKEVPNLEHCIAGQYAFLTHPSWEETMKKGGVLNTGCQVLYPVGDPT